MAARNDKAGQRRYHRAYMKARKTEFKRRLRAMKSKPCVDCEKTYPHYVMHYDHVRGTKRPGIRGVQDLVNRGYAWTTIEAEIAKCELRCANCHIMRHGRTDWALEGA